MKAVKRAVIPLYQRLATLRGRGTQPMGPEGRNALVLLSPDYGNIGDLAIGYAQEAYLKNLLPDYSVHAIPLDSTYEFLRSIRTQLTSSDVVMVTGGGNMGNLYPRVQLARMFIAKYFRKQAIVSFPQSIIYSSPQARRVEGSKEGRVISSNKLLKLCAREPQSMHEMTSLFDNNILYAPDIVLSLVDEVRALGEMERSGALLMLRGDGERRRNLHDEQDLRQQLADKFDAVTERDNTTAAHELEPGLEAKPFLNMLDVFRSHSIVVTDRLHGMIFAVITGTPCVVLPNSNHKIQGTYSAWIEGKCPYVFFLAEYSPGDFGRAVRKVTSPRATEPYSELTFDFDELDAAIRSATG